MFRFLLGFLFVVSLEARERNVDLNKMNLEDIESFFYCTLNFFGKIYTINLHFIQAQFICI